MIIRLLEGKHVIKRQLYSRPCILKGSIFFYLSALMVWAFPFALNCTECTPWLLPSRSEDMLHNYKNILGLQATWLTWQSPSKNASVAAAVQTCLFTFATTLGSEMTELLYVNILEPQSQYLHNRAYTLIMFQAGHHEGHVYLTHWPSGFGGGTSLVSSVFLLLAGLCGRLDPGGFSHF